MPMADLIRSVHDNMDVLIIWVVLLAAAALVLAILIPKQDLPAVHEEESEEPCPSSN